MKKLIICVAIGVLFAIGCNHSSGNKSSDPLVVLGSPQAATNYDYPFWNDQFQRKTDVWKKALSFCNQPDHKFLINCQPVLAVAAPRIPFKTTMPNHGLTNFGGMRPEAGPQPTK
jgi:hypothetical protein